MPKVTRACLSASVSVKNEVRIRKKIDHPHVTCLAVRCVSCSGCEGEEVRWCCRVRTDQAHVTSSQTNNNRSSQPR